MARLPFGLVKRRRGPRPQVPGHRGLGERSEPLALGLVVLRDGGAPRATREMPVQPGGSPQPAAAVTGAPRRVDMPARDRRTSGPRWGGRARTPSSTRSAGPTDVQRPAPPRRPLPSAGRRSAIRRSRAASASAGGLPFDGEGLPKALASPGQERTRSHVADAEGRRELEAGQIVDLGQEEGRALALRDAVQRALELAR